MKKIICSVLLISTLFACFAMTGCEDVSNIIDGVGDSVGDGIDKVYAYDYAYISDLKGGQIEVELKWYGFNAEHRYVMIGGTDGTKYYTGTENCVFIDDPDVDINAKTINSFSDIFDGGFTNTFVRLPSGEVLELGKTVTGSLVTYGRVRLTDQNGFKYYVDNDNLLLVKEAE